MKAFLQTLFAVWTSRKLWMTFIGVGVILMTYWQQVNYLYSFTDPAQITAFSQMTQNAMIAITAMVSAYLGINGLIQWKHNTSAEQILNSISEAKKEDITQTTTINENVNINVVKKFQEQYKDDESYKPVNLEEQ